MLTLRLAWRNLWRNRKRTFITVAALSLNTAVCIVTYGLMVGVLAKMQRNATRLTSGEVQIHAPGYRQDRSLYKTLDRPETLLESARAEGCAAVPRTYGYGLISRGGKSAGALFWGVDPVTEQAAFELAGNLAAGAYLGREPAGEIVLGRKLARALQAAVGDDVIAVVQAADGSLGNELFRVAGLFSSAGESFDRQTAMIHRADFSRLFVTENRVHEIALHGRDRHAPQDMVAALREKHPGVEVLAWPEISPHFASFMEYMRRVAWLYAFIFALVAGLGITSTMLMATFDRTWEFGVLKALGTAPWRIVRDVAAESLLLALLATGIGMAGGCAVIWIFQERGIDLSRFIQGAVSFSGAVFDPVLRPVISWAVLLPPTVIMWITALAASLYPAVKAARIHPVRAMTQV